MLIELMRRTPENTIQVKRPILLPRPIRSISESLNSIALIFITEMLARMLPAIVATEKTIYFKIRSPVSECFLNIPNISDPSVSLSILTSYRRKINIRQSYIKDTIKIMLRIVYLQGFAGCSASDLLPVLTCHDVNLVIGLPAKERDIDVFSHAVRLKSHLLLSPL